MMRRVFVKTNDNKFEECYIKAIKFKPNWFYNLDIQTEQISAIAGNDRVSVDNINPRIFYNSVYDITVNNPTSVSALFEGRGACGFVNKHFNIDMDVNISTHAYRIYLYRWDGNGVNRTTFTLDERDTYIDWFEYDFETNEMKVILKDMPSNVHDIKTKVLYSLKGGCVIRSINYAGKKYFFTREECSQDADSKLVIHTMDGNDANTFVDERRKLETEYMGKIAQLYKELDEHITELTKPKNL